VEIRPYPGEIMRMLEAERKSGRTRILEAFHKPLQFTSCKLARKKGSDKYREGDEMPSQSQKNPADNDERDGHVNRQQPLCRKFANPRSPIAERHVKKEDQCSCDP